MCFRNTAARPARSCMRRADCSGATHVSFDDLTRPTLAQIAKRMQTCEIRLSNIREGNLGLFNTSGKTIDIDTVFQILSHGKLHAGNTVRM